MTIEEFKDKYSSRRYLGDGLYSNFDGYNFWLYAQREDSEHCVALEPEVFESLLEYRKEVYDVSKNIIYKDSFK